MATTPLLQRRPPAWTAWTCAFPSFIMTAYARSRTYCSHRNRTSGRPHHHNLPHSTRLPNTRRSRQLHTKGPRRSSCPLRCCELIQRLRSRNFRMI